MKKIEMKKIEIERAIIKDLNTEIFDQKKQIMYINKLFLEEDFNYNSLLIKELEKKLSSYKNQDKEKNIYDEDSIINLSEIIEKLVTSRLKCIYCKEDILLIYKNQRDEKQWTLDRIDNDLDHSCDNTLIACLKCNLQRRRRAMEAFKFTKQLKIKKMS